MVACVVCVRLILFKMALTDFTMKLVSKLKRDVSFSCKSPVPCQIITHLPGNRLNLINAQ